MDGIVLQLQAEALDESVDIETLLRKAFLVARKLKLKDFEDWVSDEQNGYKKKIPDYRYISGQIKAWNPYHGWIQVVMHAEMAEIVNRMPLSMPLSSIAEAYKTSDGSIGLSVSAALTDLFNKTTDGFPTNYMFFSTKTEMHRIISAVRNKIMEWALLLEENGIKGSGLDFSNDEKKAAAQSQIINNYTNNFYSNVEKVDIKQGNRNG